MSWTFERVAGPFGFTEGPVWDGDGVLFTDVPNDSILKYDPAADDCRVFRTGTNGANGLALDAGDRLYGCEGTYRRVVRYDEAETVTLATDCDGARLNGPNDLCLDPDGRLWFSDPNYSGNEEIQQLAHESVYRLDPPKDAGRPERATTDTARPSGVQLSRDGRRLFVADAKFREERIQELRAYPVAADGRLGKSVVVHDFAPHRGVDGMCLDADGHVVAAAGWERSGPGPTIYVLDPEGTVVARHPFPADRPTNCAFGGPDRRTLYVTASGCLFRAKTDRQGLEPPFA